MRLLQVRVLLGFLFTVFFSCSINIRDLFFKTTHARHPSSVSRFVYSFLRLRKQAVFFVRPRSRFSLFFRLQVLRKMFVWFYTDRFARRSFFRRLVKTRTGSFRTFLNFCTTLETYIPVALYRFHFVDNMRDAFYALRAGLVFCNGRVVNQVGQVLRLGDVLEVRQLNVFKVMGFAHLIKCLPTLRFRLTLKDSIVNTELFYSVFARNYSFFAIADRFAPVTFSSETVIARLPYVNPQHVEGMFFAFFLSRLFLSVFRCNLLLRHAALKRYTEQLSLEQGALRSWMVSARPRGAALWWVAPSALGLAAAPAVSLFSFTENETAVFERIEKSEELGNTTVPAYIRASLEGGFAYADRGESNNSF